jgi:Regulator of chromosome condensation (RCC1) repeat
MRLVHQVQLPHRRIAIAASLVAAAFLAPAACLPSVQFASSNDGGTEGSLPDVGAPDVASETATGAQETGTDGTADGPVRSDGGMGGGDSGESGSVQTAFLALASSQYPSYDCFSACVVHDGALTCWGSGDSNGDGQLGFANEDAGYDGGLIAPLVVSSTALPASQIVQLSMGAYHTCALYGTTAYCWGTNQSGQLGMGIASSVGGPTEVAVVSPPAGGFVQLASTAWTTCGIGPVLSGGSVSNIYCWGDNGSGELGRPISWGNSGSPVPVTGDVDGGPLGVIPDAVQIAGGYNHFCALTAAPASRIFCWGTTDSLECGPVRGPANCPSQNSTTCTDEPLEVKLPATETPVALALGDIHSCALTAAGNVYCWGSNIDNQLGSASAADDCPLSGEADAGCAGSPVQVNVSGIQHLYAAGYTTCAIDDDVVNGKPQPHTRCWGANNFGQMGVGTDEPMIGPVEMVSMVNGIAYTFDDLAMGEFAVCGRQDDQIYCWGGGVIPFSDQVTPLPFSF